MDPSNVVLLHQKLLFPREREREREREKSVKDADDVSLVVSM